MASSLNSPPANIPVTSLTSSSIKQRNWQNLLWYWQNSLTLVTRYQKEQEAIQQIENKTYRRSTPTVEEYCEKWLLMQSAQIRMTTLIDYTSKVKNYIIKPLGDMHMGDVTADDIRLALLAASKKSASVYISISVFSRQQ